MPIDVTLLAQNKYNQLCLQEILSHTNMITKTNTVYVHLYTYTPLLKPLSLLITEF